MTNICDKIHTHLLSHSVPEEALKYSRYFRTDKGEYAEHDAFLGIPLFVLRQTTKQYYVSIPLHELDPLIHSRWHEERRLALMILLEKYKKSRSEEQRQSVYDYYTTHLDGVNSWDLVDISAPTLIGEHLRLRDRSPLLTWASSSCVWTRRVALLSTLPWIKKGDFHDFEILLETLKRDPHDMIRKPLGWLLREVGKADEQHLLYLLHRETQNLSSTTLTYAMEKLPASVKREIRSKR